MTNQRPATIDASRARVKTRTPFFAQLCIPYSGTISMADRRKIAAELRWRVRADHVGARGATIAVMNRHVLASFAGTREATAWWVQNARLAGLVADIATDVLIAAPTQVVADAPAAGRPPSGGLWPARRLRRAA